MTLRLTAHNQATESENRIHSDEVARQYGFRGGLVPGIAVYGYLMQAVEGWPASLAVRFFKPVFDGDELVIRRDGDSITGERDGELCARVTIGPVTVKPVSIAGAPLPAREMRPLASADTLIPGRVLGTVRKPLADTRPESLLELANQALLQNFQLGPWLHASSEIVNEAEPLSGDEVTACSRIQDRFAKKGREFVVLDLVLSAGDRRLQTVRHTAIYQLPAPV